MAHVIDSSKLAKNWLIGAGIAAACLITFLIWADDYLTNSKREVEVNKTMNEIRTAQSSLPSRVTDSRQTVK